MRSSCGAARCDDAAGEAPRVSLQPPPATLIHRFIHGGAVASQVDERVSPRAPEQSTNLYSTWTHMECLPLPRRFQ